jgi:peptidoglycan/xylan/chitin deacetylase (PgdA/CDA1 family)
MAKFSSPGWRLLGSLVNRFHVEEWVGKKRLVVVLFHHITDNVKWFADDPLIAGLNVAIPLDAFRHRIRWLVNRYDPVSLDDVIANGSTRTKRSKLLICFDDGYASVAELAAPLLKELRIPWCYFINAGFVGNGRLPVDNIVAYIANVHGPKVLAKASGTPIQSARQFIAECTSGMNPDRRRDMIELLARQLDIDTNALAQQNRLFVDENQIRQLAQSGVEIGNHTFDHVHCRSLDHASAEMQIGGNARVVESMSGKPVRAFAYPYGSLQDATALARTAVRNSGHQCAFVVQNRTNSPGTDKYALYRIDLGEMEDGRAALELEVLPRLRQVVAGLRARPAL